MTRGKKTNGSVYEERCATVTIPKELRLGQAIVNAMSRTYGDDKLTSLYYISDSELQKIINNYHKPYGFK